MFDDDILMTLGRVAEVLEQLGVEWAVGGSLASSVHSEPRSTNDIDIIAKLGLIHARRFVRALGDDFYADEAVVAEAIEANRSFNVIDQRTIIKVDVFVPPEGPMGEGPGGHDLQKLRWFELGGRVSDRQWLDIRKLLRVRRSSLNLEYLETTARAAGLAELLARALEQAK